jgi:hypothetical protein
MGAEGSAPCEQQLAIDSNPQPPECSRHPHIIVVLPLNPQPKTILPPKLRPPFQLQFLSKLSTEARAKDTSGFPV